VTDLRDSAMLDFHPVADIFPMMSDHEFLNLVKDIEANGLREPVWLHQDGRIIDGRNRYRACREVGIEPDVRVFVGEDSDLIPFVVSLNLHRRHLSESQRAMVGARIEQFEQGRPNKDANLHVKREGAAEMLSVSARSIASAKRVRETAAPELVEAVVAGKVAVSTAAVIAEHATVEEQRELLAAQDNKAIVHRANRIRETKREQSEVRKPNRKPLPDVARNAGWELNKAVERIARIADDDRFAKNAEQVATLLRHHLLRSVETLTEVLAKLPNESKENGTR
jgi:ParB-like nuclease domain